MVLVVYEAEDWVVVEELRHDEVVDEEEELSEGGDADGGVVVTWLMFKLNWSV